MLQRELADKLGLQRHVILKAEASEKVRPIVALAAAHVLKCKRRKGRARQKEQGR